MGSRGKNSLKRRGPSRRTARTIHIFCEGLNTEPDYFRALANSMYPRKVKVKPQGGLGSPKSIVNKARQEGQNLGLLKGQRKKRDSYEVNDQIWVVFDRDNWTEVEFAAAKAECKKRGIKYAYSNPCFELWLILHHRDFDGPALPARAARMLKALDGNYDVQGRKTADFKSYVNSVPDAEQRAERQRQRRRVEGNADGNPSTSVYELTRLLR